MPSWSKPITALTALTFTLVSTTLALPQFSPAAATTTTQASTDLCGDSDYIILDNTPWIVYNMLYNAAETVGTQCTYFDKTTTSGDTQEVVWSSETNIEYVEAT
jgi:hypothetical protein